MVGWYVVAQPCTHFEIHETAVNRSRHGDYHENGLITVLYVDGQNLHHGMSFVNGIAEFFQRKTTVLRQGWYGLNLAEWMCRYESSR